MTWKAPDAVQFMINVLAPVLGPVPVGGKGTSGAKFLKVIRTGGPRATPISDRPQLTFEAYAKLPSQAWALAEEARTTVLGIAGTVVHGVSVKEITELSGPSDLPDPVFPEHSRYTFTLAIHLRATKPS